MSLFVIAYDKSTQSLLTVDRFPVSARARADARRLELESEYRDRLVDVEVSVLEATSKQALLKTHARYFRSAAQLAQGARFPTARHRSAK